MKNKQTMEKEKKIARVLWMTLIFIFYFKKSKGVAHLDQPI